MPGDDQYLCDVPFFAMVDLGGLPARASLESLSGMRSDPGPYPTSLVERCEIAWRTPLAELTCGQVSTLAGQQLGLEWLGAAMLRFAARHPLAEMHFYPGELGVSLLGAAEPLARIAPEELRAWLEGDFGWLDAAYGDDRGQMKRVTRMLAEARAVAGLG